MGANGLNVAGNITRTAGLITSTGTVTLNGTTAAQSADFTASTINNLVVNNTSGTPTVTLNNTAAFTWNANLTLTAGTLVLANFTQTIGGNVSGAGTLNASAVTGANSLTVSGYMGTTALAVGALSAPSTAVLNVGSDWNVTAFTPNGGTVVFTGAGTVYSTTSFANLTVNNAGSTTANAAITVTGNLSLTAGTLAMGANGLNVAGNITRTAGLITSTGTVTLNGTTAAQSADFTASTINNLVVDNTSGTPTVTLNNTAAFTWNANLTLTAGTLVLANFTQTIGGNVSGAGTLNASAVTGANSLTVSGYMGTTALAVGALSAPSTAVLNVGSDWNVTAFTPNGGTVVFTGAGMVYSTTSFANLTVNNAGSTTANAAITVTGNLSLTAGTLAMGANGLNVAGNITRTAGLITSTGTITLNGTTAAQSADFTASTINNLVVDNTSGTPTVTPSAPITLGGTLSLTAGTLAMGANGLNVAGNITRTAGLITSTGTVTLNGTTAAQSVDFTSSILNNLTVNNSFATAPQASATGLTSLPGNLTLTAGTLSIGATGLSIGGNVTHGTGALSSTGTVTLNGSAGQSVDGLTFYDLTINLPAQADTVTSTGGWTVTNLLTLTQGTWLTGVFTHTIAGAWNSSSATFTFTAAVGSTISLSPTATPGITTKGLGTDPFYNLALASGGSLATDVAATNNLTITAGTLGLNTHNLTVGLNLTGNAIAASASEAIIVGGGWNLAAFTPATSTVTFTGSGGAGPFTVTSNSQSFSTVVLNAAGKTYQQAAGATGVAAITLGMTLTAGTWSTNGEALTVGGSLTGTGALTAAAAETITVGGNWNLPAFSPASSTVLFDAAGTTTIAGNTTFFNFTVPSSVAGKTVQFTAGSTQTINGTFSVAGVFGNLTSLVSTSSPTQWDLHIVGSTAVTYAVVQDSNALSGLTASAVTSSDFGNNQNWNFGANALTWTGATSTNWSVANNWTPGYIPNSTDSITIPNTGGNNPILTSNVAVSTMNITTGILDLAGFNLTVSTTLTDSGTLKLQGGETVSYLTFNPSTGLVNYYGAGPYATLAVGNSYANLTFSGTGSWSAGGTVTATGSLTLIAGTFVLGANGLNVAGNITRTAGLLTSTGTVTLNGSTAAQSVDFTSSTLNNLTVNNSFGTAPQVTAAQPITLGGSLALTLGTLALGANALAAGGSISGAGTLTTSGSQTITVGGSFTPAAFTASTSTVTLNTATPASVSALSFYDLVINKSAQADTVTSTGAWTVTNLLTLTQGTWLTGVFTHTIAGAWNSSSATFTFTAAVGSTISLSPTATPGITTKGLGTDPFYNLALASGGSLATDVAATNNLTITAGTLGLNTHNLTVGLNLTGNAIAASASEAIIVGGSFTPAAFTASTSTVTLNTATPASVSALSFYDLVINKSAQADTVTSTGAWTVTNLLTLTQGTWLTGVFTHTIAGAWNSSSATFTFTAAVGSTISLSPTATPGITTKGLGTDPFYNLALASGGSLATDVAATNNLTITAGTLGLNTHNLTVGLNLTGNALAASASEAIIVGGSFTPAAFTASTSTVTLNTATPASVSALSFYDLVINKSAQADTVTSTGAWTVTNLLTLTQGTWLTGVFTHTIAGAWNSSSATFTFTAAVGSTISLSPTANPSITTKGLGTDPFYNLALASGGSLATDVAATNNLTITAGTLGLNTHNLTVGLNLTGNAIAASASEAIIVGGSFTPAAFTASTSTVTLNTATPASVSALSFYDLVINKSAQADTVTSTGAWTVTNLLTLTQGTWLTGVFTHTIAGAWNSSSATFTFTAAVGSTISLSPTATPSITTKGLGTDPFYNLALASGGSLATDVAATNNLTITAGTLGLNTHNLTVGLNLTGNALAASASEAIIVGGGWNLAAFTPATSTVTFTGSGGAGPFTVTSNSQSFSTVVLNAAGKTYQQAAGATGVAAITLGMTLTAGTWSTNGEALTVGGSLAGAGSLTATASETITVGANFTPAAFTQATSTVVLDTAAAASVSGLTFYNLTINKSVQADTVTSTGGWTVTNSLTMTRGTWLTGAFTHTIAGSWDSSSSTFTFTAAVGSTISLSPTANPSITTKGVGTDAFYNLSLASGGSLATAVQATNNLGITAGTLTLNGNNLSVGVNLAGNALTTSASEAISVGGNWNVTTFTPSTSTVTFTGVGTIQPVTMFYNLAINTGALGNIVTLLANITINNSLTITTGTLSAGIYTITMNGGTWTNAGGAFNPGTGTVVFQGPALLTISGSNSWFNFTCLTDSKTIKFQPLATQTILAGGNFNVHASSSAPASLITLTTALANAAANGAPPPALLGQWIINDLSLLPQVIDNVNVSWSYAFPQSITPGPGALDSGNNFNWNFVIPIIASWTLDTNNNGRIDRIRVQVKTGTQLSDSFGGFKVEVNGAPITTFTGVGANTDVFDILLPEGTVEDSDSTPSWRVLANAGAPLYGLVGGALVDHDPKKYYTAASGARPVITYTTAAVGSTKVYVHFSALAYADNAGTALPTTGPGPNAYLAYSDVTNSIVSMTPVEKVGTGAHAAIITLSKPLISTDIFPSPFFVSAVTLPTAKLWGSPYPATFTYPTSGSSTTLTSPGDPGSYANTNADGQGYLQAGGTSATATSHNVSDVGLNFVTPVFALDRDLTRDPTNGGIGLVTVFDGSKWLPPQNTMVEARVMVSTLNNASITMYWDTNPTPTMDFHNIWIPTTATTLWQAGTPNGPGDRVHFPGYNGAVGAVAPSAINGPLRDFIVASSNPAIKDGATFQFLFTLDDGLGHILPCAFPDPNDPSVVRPFEYDLHSVIQQRGQVTITNNVINPTAGQVAHLQYVLQKSGSVTITVFDLSGSIITVLERGTQAAGSYTTGWDGKNRSGTPVARGIYFIRAVGPDFDEIRKVLVVR